MEIRAFNMMYKVGKNILWNSIGSLFYFGCQWLLTVLVVYFKNGYSDAGMLSLAMSLANVLGIIACLNLRTFQISELNGQFSDGDFLYNRILTSGIALVLCVGVVIYKGYSWYESLCIFIFMTFKVSEALTDVFHGIVQKVWRLDIAGKSLVLRGFTIGGAIVSGIFFDKSLIVTIIVMAVLSYLVIFFYDYPQCKKQSCADFRFNRHNVLALVKIGIPLALYFVSLNAISTYSRFQIEEQCGKELLGVFSSIATPTVLVTQMSSFIFSPLMGIFARYRQENNIKRTYQLLLVSVGGIAIIGATAVMAGKLFGEWALVLLFGEPIRGYSYLLIPIICTATLTAVTWLLGGLLTVFSDYYVMAALTAVSLLLCIIITPTLIAERQLMGAVLSLSAALILEILLLAIRLIYLLKRKKHQK